MTAERNPMAQRRHELLTEVEHNVKALAMDLGIPSDKALHLGVAAADMLLEHWGGQQITFPRSGYYGMSPRELAIVERRNQGARVFELAREFGMTERGIRKLLKRADAGRTTASAQLPLFGTALSR